MAESHKACGRGGGGGGGGCVCVSPRHPKITLRPSRVSQEKPLDVLAILFQRKFRNGQKLVDFVERDVPDW